MSLAKRNSPPGRNDPRDRRDAFVLHEAPLPVPPLRPRIGIEQIEPDEARGRQPRQQVGRVAVMQPDVVELALVDRGQRLGHAVDERLDADEAGARMPLGLGDQMFAAAEAAFEPDLVDAVEQRAQIGRARARTDRARAAAAACPAARPGAAAADGPCAGRRRRRYFLDVSTCAAVMPGLVPGMTASMARLCPSKRRCAGTRPAIAAY